jgi:hypothetical protein
MTDAQVPSPDILSPDEVELSKDGGMSLALRVLRPATLDGAGRGGEPIRDVQVVNPLPLERELRFVCFLDRKGKELAMIRVDGRVPRETRALIEEALSRRHLRALIRRIDQLDIAGNSLYFVVQTDRGPREFVVKNLADNIVRPSPGHLVIVDAHENRYEILDMNSLDPRSLKLLHAVL